MAFSPIQAVVFWVLALACAAPAVAQDGPLYPRQFGAKGDGASDDTKALQLWLNAVGKNGGGYCSAGTYRVKATLIQPSHSTVEGTAQCVISPDPDFRGVVWQQGSASVLHQVTIDGSQTRNPAIGLAFDLRPVPINGGIFGVTRSVTIRDFRTPGSVGLDAGSTVHWSLQNLDLDGNYDNLHIGFKLGSEGRIATNTLNCDKCEIRAAVRWGIHGDAGGQEIYLNQPEIILSGAEGIYLDSLQKSPRLNHFIVNGGHIELNNKPGQYQISARDVDNLVLRDTKFEPELQTQCATHPRAIRIVNGKDFLLDNVHVCPRGQGVRIDDTASGTVANWPGDLNGPTTASVLKTGSGRISVGAQ